MTLAEFAVKEYRYEIADLVRLRTDAINLQREALIKHGLTASNAVFALYQEARIQMDREGHFNVNSLARRRR